MLVGLYTAATGLEAAERNHEIIARDLAHISVPGYRGSTVTFETFESALESATQADSPQGHGVMVDTYDTDFTPGAYAHTGRSLDVALQGDSFFEIEGPDGPLYTRSGVFFLASDGRLVNSTGLNVMGDGGPITVPPPSSEADVSIAPDGSISVAGTSLGKLRVVSFENNGSLTRAGTTLFQAPDGVTPTETEGMVQQGVREQSNVSAVDKLVQMIVNMRFHEAAERALSTMDSAIGNVTNPQA